MLILAIIQQGHGAVYISGSGQPLSPSDASALLLDRIRDGGDVVLIGDGGAECGLLDQAAVRLAHPRWRILQAPDVLPDVADRSTSAVADDEFLTKSYRALTRLDETCDRIVLLISNAHALEQSTLRYIQFVSRSCGHLQLVFSGMHGFLDLLGAERFAWLRERLLTGLVMTLATPIVAVQEAFPAIPAVPDDPAPLPGDAAALRPGVPKPTFSTGILSRRARLAPLALACLGGAGWLVLCIQHGAHDGPATSRQDLVQPGSLVQPTIVAADKPADGHGNASAASGTSLATPASAASRPPLMAGYSPVPGSAWRSGKAPAHVIGSAAEEPGLTKPPVPGSSSNRSVSASSPQALEPVATHLPATVVSTPDGRASDVAVSQSSEAAARTVVAALPQSKTGLPSSGTSELRWPEAVQAPGSARNGAPAAPLHNAAASSRKTRRIKLLAKQLTPLPADDPWLAAQPVSSTGDGSQRYIGSYATNADGVRVFHLDP